MWAEHALDCRLSAIRHQNDSLYCTARELEMRDDSPFVFLCECADPFCVDYVKLTIAEYAALRNEVGPILCPGHDEAGTAVATQAA